MHSAHELMDLSGRVALVMGGAGHIGGMICDTLGELGAAVVCADIDATRGAGLVDDLRAAGRRATFVTCDMADERAVRSLVDGAVGLHGRLDILVHAAGFVNQGNTKGYATTFEQQTMEPWRKAMDVNLASAFVAVQQAAGPLRVSGHGAVVLFGSIYGMGGPDMRLYEGQEGVGNAPAYAASKGAVIQLARWLATTLAPDIRVNTVTPGGIERGQGEAFVRRYVERTPMRRMGREEDLKGAVAYLASDLSRYVTGHNLVVDGGWSAW